MKFFYYLFFLAICGLEIEYISIIRDAILSSSHADEWVPCLFFINANMFIGSDNFLVSIATFYTIFSKYRKYFLQRYETPNSNSSSTCVTISRQQNIYLFFFQNNSVSLQHYYALATYYKVSTWICQLYSSCKSICKAWAAYATGAMKW